MKGHQDSSSPFKSLSFPAKLNVEADHLTSSFHHEGPLSTQNNFMTPSCRAKLSIQGVSVTNNYTKNMMWAYIESKYIQCLQNHFRLNPEVTLTSGQDYIGDYTAFRDIVLLPKSVMAFIQWWKHQKNNSCVLCTAQETTSHMLWCQHSSRREWRGSCISNFRNDMAAHDTALHVQDLFCTTLTKWFNTETVQTATYYESFHNILI